VFSDQAKNFITMFVPDVMTLPGQLSVSGGAFFVFKANVACKQFAGFVRIRRNDKANSVTATNALGWQVGLMREDIPFNVIPSNKSKHGVVTRDGTKFSTLHCSFHF
jgi:hypothetical protein